MCVQSMRAQSMRRPFLERRPLISQLICSECRLNSAAMISAANSATVVPEHSTTVLLIRIESPGVNVGLATVVVVVPYIPL